MFKKLLAKIFGKYLENKAGLYDGTPTEGRAWYLSRTILAGIVVLLRAIYEGVSQIMVAAGKPPLPPIPPVVDTILGLVLGGTVIEGRVSANKPITIGKDVAPKDQAPT